MKKKKKVLLLISITLLFVLIVANPEIVKAKNVDVINSESNQVETEVDEKEPEDTIEYMRNFIGICEDYGNIIVKRTDEIKNIYK